MSDKEARVVLMIGALGVAVLVISFAAHVRRDYDLKIAQLTARNASLQTANTSLRHECRGPMPWEGK